MMLSEGENWSLIYAYSMGVQYDGSVERESLPHSFFVGVACGARGVRYV